MWGIFIGSLLFVYAIIFHPSGVDWIIATMGMTLALAATARYTANLLTPTHFLRKTVYDDLGEEATSAKPPTA